MADFVLIFRANWFCADQTSVFNVFLKEVIILLFNNNYAPEMTQWQSL